MLNYHRIETNSEGMVKMKLADDLVFVFTIDDQAFILTLDKS